MSIEMTHPLHQHGLIPVASGLLRLPHLALVLVNHHGVDGVCVCIPVAGVREQGESTTPDCTMAGVKMLHRE